MKEEIDVKNTIIEEINKAIHKLDLNGLVNLYVDTHIKMYFVNSINNELLIKIDKLSEEINDLKVKVNSLINDRNNI